MMNKILALVAALAMSCFGSMVFAAEGDAPVVKGNIEIYGAAKLSVDVIDTGTKTDGADKGLTKISSNSSRIGFKGSEALSDDLSAVYQLELGVNMDGTTQTAVESVTSATTNTITGVTTVKTKDASVNTLGLRNTFVGLKSKDLGMLILGTHDTPYKLSTLQFDPFGDSMGDYNAIIGNVMGTASFDLRPKDVAAYVSPSLGGVTISVADVVTGEEAAVTGARTSAYSASVLYGGGPVNLALAYEVHNTGEVAVTGAKLGAGVTFGGTKIGLVYEKIKDDTADSVNTRDAMYVSLTQKLGNETIKLAYGSAADGKSAADTAATMMAIGVDHAFSKRTSAYVLYAATTNNAGATYGLGQGGAGGAYKPAADEDPSVISIGMNHSF